MAPTARSRTTLDILLGIVILLIGAAMIAYSAVATSISLALLGWLPIAIGVSLAISGAFRREQPNWWVRVVAGALLIILGIIFLVRPETTKFTLTIISGAYFIVSGSLRVIDSYASTQNRLILSVGGILSIVMGAVVLLSLRDESSVTLGLMIGAEMVIEGLTLALAGSDPRRMASSRRIASKILDDERGRPHAPSGTAGSGEAIYEPPEIERG